MPSYLVDAHFQLSDPIRYEVLQLIACEDGTTNHYTLFNHLMTWTFPNKGHDYRCAQTLLLAFPIWKRVRLAWLLYHHEQLLGRGGDHLTPIQLIMLHAQIKSETPSVHIIQAANQKETMPEGELVDVIRKVLEGEEGPAIGNFIEFVEVSNRPKAAYYLAKSLGYTTSTQYLIHDVISKLYV